MTDDRSGARVWEGGKGSSQGLADESRKSLSGPVQGQTTDRSLGDLSPQKPRAQPLGGSAGSGHPPPKKNGRTTPTFYAAADCSARNWVYHPYFVMYNNLDQGIGPPTLKAWLCPCQKLMISVNYTTMTYTVIEGQRIFCQLNVIGGSL